MAASKKVVLVVDDVQGSYYKPFAEFGSFEYNPRILKDNPHSVVLAVFTGGEDVTPSLYGDEKNPKTWDNPDRDKREKEIFDRLRELSIPIAGICRGSQFICAMSGGKLIQHVSNHAGVHHQVLTDDGRKITVTSSHHQMQFPNNEAVPVAWADPRRSDEYEGPPGKLYHPDREHDVVFYPNTNALGMQYHPEWMQNDSEGFQYPSELVERFFGLERKVGQVEKSI